MIYVTTRQKIKEHQITWLDLIQNIEPENTEVQDGSAGTITRVYEEIPERLLETINVPAMIETLKKFNQSHENLFSAERKSLYRRFYLPKKTGGLRPIDQPNDELQNALEELRIILSDRFGLLYHTAGFAYIKKRSTTQLVRKHQQNESNWFYKTDVSGFFPSTTLDFAMRMLSMIFPLSEIYKIEEGKRELKKAISLGFLNGGLPQGTKLSPYLTNLISVPIDHRLFNDLAHRRYVYTRYADDIHISCVQSFDPDKMTAYIKRVFKEFGAPWELKPEKTHYGNRKGHNYMLGVCLNKDNNITVGYKTKQIFHAMTNNLIMDWKHKKYWSPDEVQHYVGLLSYYKMVEKEYFTNLIYHYEKKYNVNIKEIIKQMTSLS